MDKLHESIIEMLLKNDEPFFLKMLKEELCVKGPFVGYGTIECEPTVHLGTGQAVYAVRQTTLVKDWKHAKEYREYLKEYGVNVDRLIRYTQDLEALVLVLLGERKNE